GCGGVGGRGWKGATHRQDVLGVDEAAQLSRLLEGRDGQRGGASLESRVSDRYCAVSVAAGLYDREQSRAPRKVAEDALAVGADGAEVDVSPAQRRLQRPPWRSTFMTTGISGSRSPASRPESPRRSEIRRPAAACTYTPVNAAVKVSSPCASRPPMRPARTSPVPPLASAGTSCGSSLRRPSGWAATVRAPFRTTTAPQSFAALRA